MSVWVDDLGTRYRLVHKLLPVRCMEFDGDWWVDGGRIRGVVLEMRGPLGERWYVKPEDKLALNTKACRLLSRARNLLSHPRSWFSEEGHTKSRHALSVEITTYLLRGDK